YRDRINQQLQRHLIQTTAPTRLQQAMYYGVFNGGKRIRPLLVYLTGEALGIPLEQADNTASAIELIHNYSLIHDDLPAMDDDDLRRGNPTVHLKFDDATAILTGDAMQTLAFELIAIDARLTSDVRVELIQLIARSAGATGMVAGQVIDIEAETLSISASELENMHRRKTGDLISASVLAPAIIARADSPLTQSLQTFGYALGLAFQVKDDILDEVGETEVMGKQQGSDHSRNKTTFVSAHGLNAAIAYLDELRQEAIKALEPLGENSRLLLELTDYVANRDH
ncbi:MAG: polyprenyl synthetase family protein, partial [bacterium]